MTIKQKETGQKLGITLIGILIGFLILDFAVGFKPGPFLTGPVAIITGIYFQYVGILFIISYYYEDKCFFFRWIIWFCKFLNSTKKGPHTAFIFFAGFVGMGTYVLLIGLGVSSSVYGLFFLPSKT